MEHPSFCTIQSNISPPNCQQLSKNWGHSQAQIKILIPGWESNRTLCVSMSRELLSGQIQLLNPLQSCCDPKGMVLCPCVTTSGSTGHLTLSFLFPWSLPRFPAHPCTTAHLQQVTVSMDSAAGCHPLMFKLCILGRKSAGLRQVERKALADRWDFLSVWSWNQTN